MPADPTLTQRVDDYLDLFEATEAPLDGLAETLADGVRFLEHPNLVNPDGTDRDRVTMLAGAEAGWSLLAWQRFEDRRHEVLSDDRVVTRATWRGEVAVDAGPLSAGQQLRADVAMFTTWRDGRLVEQENYDCYHPIDADADADAARPRGGSS